MPYLTPQPKMQFFTANGQPLVGGKLYTYAAGTNTLLATYVDQAGSANNTNPTILDSRGEASVWLAVGLLYDFVLKDSLDSLIWTVSNLGGGNGTSQQYFTGTGSTTIFTMAAPPFSKTQMMIFINGVYQNKNTWTIAGPTLTFSQAPPLTSIIEVTY